MESHLDLVPVGLEHVPAQALRAGAYPMACSIPSIRSQWEDRLVAAVASWSGSVTSISSTSASVGQLAGRAPGQREPTSRTAQDDLGALALGRPRHGEGQRRVGEDAGDEDSLSIEESHRRVRLS